MDILTQEGYDVDQSFSGEDALIKIADNQYDACILDLVFKHTKTQGLETLKILHATLPQLPVVVMSGRASDEVVLNTIGEGCFSFIVKPVFDLYLLLHIIREAVGKNQPSVKVLPQAENAIAARIKGLPVDAHLYLRQYLCGFESFTRDFKGQKVTITGIESILDDLKVRMVSDAPRQEVIRWMGEYLSFAEQFEPVNPLFETDIYHNEALAAVEHLKSEVEQFTNSIEKSSRRNYIDPGFQGTADGEIFKLHYQKICNQVRLKKETSETAALRLAVLRITEQTQHLIEEDQTLEALNGLFDFSHHYKQDDLKKEIIRIRAQLNRLVNHNQSGQIDFLQFSAIKDRIHSALLCDVLDRVGELSYR